MSFGKGTISSREHSRRSPLPVIWPEKYEDMYFQGETGMVNVLMKDANPQPYKDGQFAIEIKPSKILSIVERRFPAWRTLLAEIETQREKMRQGTLVLSADDRNPHFQSFGTFDRALMPATPAAYNLYNIGHFNSMPSVDAWRKQYINTLVEWRIIKSEDMLHSAYAELMHTLYHLSLWRSEGRRVYVLDETLYTMLGHTELPQFPLDMLAFRQHSFYLKFPDRAFQFSVPNYMSGQMDREWAEGVMVSIDETQPDTGRQREICFVVCGDGSATRNSANTAYITAGLGPDGRMCDVRFNSGTDFSKDEEDEALRTIMPRVVLGLCLYIQSEHPDLEPVPPPPKRDLSVIKSTRKKAKIVRRITNQSKLGYIYVGRRIAEIEAHEFQKRLTIVGPRGHKLEKPVWVSGHWRQQKVGHGRKQIRMVWIRPYRKGPDFDETIKIRAAKIQPARSRDHV